MLPCGRDDLLPLALRDPAPDVVGRERQADGAGATGEETQRTSHARIVTATGSSPCRCRCRSRSISRPCSSRAGSGRRARQSKAGRKRRGPRAVRAPPAGSDRSRRRRWARERSANPRTGLRAAGSFPCPCSGPAVQCASGCDRRGPCRASRRAPARELREREASTSASSAPEQEAVTSRPRSRGWARRLAGLAPTPAPRAAEPEQEPGLAQGSEPGARSGWARPRAERRRAGPARPASAPRRAVHPVSVARSRPWVATRPVPAPAPRSRARRCARRRGAQRLPRRALPCVPPASRAAPPPRRALRRPRPPPRSATTLPSCSSPLLPNNHVQTSSAEGAGT